jgi:hypothetical protein
MSMIDGVVSLQDQIEYELGEAYEKGWELTVERNDMLRYALTPQETRQVVQEYDVILDRLVAYTTGLEMLLTLHE